MKGEEKLWSILNEKLDTLCATNRLPQAIRVAETALEIAKRAFPGAELPLAISFEKLWFVLRYYGVEGLQFHIREHVRLAQEFAEWVSRDARFELAAPVPLNLVCFRLKSGDEDNQRLMDALNRSGDLYLTHTRLKEKMTLRLCVGQTNTTRRHVEKAWRRIQEEASRL